MKVPAIWALLASLCTAGGALADEAPVTVKHGIAMHGEPRYGADFSHFDYVNPHAPKGGTLRLHVVANGFDSFNPFVIRGVAASGVSTYVYDTLLTSSDDEPFSAYGLIAESLETPADRSFVVFNLRPEARFQDGKPITAEDVAFSFELLTTKGHPFFRSYYSDVSKVTVESPHRIRFDFADDNRELPLILGQLPILPKHFWAERDFDRAGLTIPVGSGPYRIDSFDAGRSVTFRRVEDYWARDLPVSRGRHNIDQIRYDYYSDSTVALEAFKAGHYDFRLESSAKDWATAYTGDAFRRGRVTVEELDHGRPAGMQAFVFNTRKPQFSDPKVRQALAYAFDFEWANRNLFHDQYSRTQSFFENSDLASTGLPSEQELAILEPYRDRLPPEVFSKVYTPPTLAEGQTLRDNLRIAMQLLREAGYEVRNGKMIHATSGQPLRFEILLHQKNFERIVLPFKTNLERLGIEVDVRLVDTNQYVQRVRAFDFDIITQVLPQSNSPGNEQRDYWHSANADVQGSRNFMGIRNPVVDELLELVIRAPDRESLVHRVRALDRVLLWHHYVIPQWYLGVDRIAYWNHLQRPEQVPKAGFNLSTWWVRETN